MNAYDDVREHFEWYDSMRTGTALIAGWSRFGARNSCRTDGGNGIAAPRGSGSTAGEYGLALFHECRRRLGKIGAVLQHG